ncbi:MAG: peptidoglycan DD-metalloendopeptidase family protein [Chloroflexi bacterium]|nr:peptidoglycan DD-metalloendopeptidase family protein [Chloroflexota bacterium]MCI0576051.1 peptidoglycan DD-metalloendopeptidase family protein [Chloroflexota bacterium]MCI0647839.1 peptidoglycan DD-metalloendopeptidase family protein [Chloroflexota bacterium]MCI0727090.1 peptidoglycan DD-metalloendopeptidase family protein [Chloroflexota bacterium]
MRGFLLAVGLLLVGLVLAVLSLRPTGAQGFRQHLVQPGDTWIALAWRFGLPPAELQGANPFPNRQRQPAVGATIQVPDSGRPERPGVLVRSGDGGLLQTAVAYGANPWQLARENGLSQPFQPLFYRPLFIPGGQAPPRDLPAGFSSLELSRVPARPGQALALRAVVEPGLAATAQLNLLPFNTFTNGQYLVGLGGSGAFYVPGDHELLMQPAGRPAWSQPWRMVAGEWTYQQITLTGEAAAIDAASIAEERERLFALWSPATPAPQWSAPFQLPINDYLEISSQYGARRSYNGGPYRSYHEGLDFSAYGGTPVYAPAAGTVVLAERLYVRGGAVIIDHGLGIYSGFYHMSEVVAQVGQGVTPGQLIGHVGTTGLSTGNHLHWDLLVSGIWIDAQAWLDQDLACWILAGWGQPCEPPTS